MKNVPTGLSSLRIKLDKLNVDNLLPVPFDLNKLSDVVRSNVVTKNVYNAKIKDTEDKIHFITKLATNTTLNSKVNEVKNKIPNITKLDTTAAVTAIENKISNANNLVKILTIT